MMINKIIIPVGYGRTCNRLFQIIHWMPTSIIYDIPIYFPCFNNYAEHFKGTNTLGVARFPKVANDLSIIDISFIYIFRLTDRINIKVFSFVFKLLLKLTGDAYFEHDDSGENGLLEPDYVIKTFINSRVKTLWVKGWLYRDTKGLKTYRSIIRDYFAPTNSISLIIDKFCEKARENIDILVGVHLRRGDYREFNNGQYFYSDSEFINIFKQLENIFNGYRVRFMLVSNELINIENYKEFDIVIGLGESIFDLFSLSKCDYIIGPPSTYSAWASWYNYIPRYELADVTEVLQLNMFEPVYG